MCVLAPPHVGNLCEVGNVGFLAMQPLRGSHIGIYAVAVRLAHRCVYAATSPPLSEPARGSSGREAVRSVGRDAWRRLNPRLIVIATLAGCPYSRLSAPQRSLSFSPISP